jgi:ribonuclease HI
MKKVTIYTDGSCIGNPGPGGFGTILRYKEHEKVLTGSYKFTTNNRMELLAVITGLEALKEICDVTVYTDSQYVVNSLQKGWARGWQDKGWRKGGKDVPNTDLWKRVLELCDKHKVTLKWVRGHNGNTDNERCDQLSNTAAVSYDQIEDIGYKL